MMIASRLLKLRTATGDRDIPVRIFLPEESGDGDWSCRYEIDWPHGQRVNAACGVDSVQALVLALQMIGSEIYASEHHESGDLFVDADTQGYGFPVAHSLRDLLVGYDAKFL